MSHALVCLRFALTVSFLQHDCDNNCELFRNGRYITFRAIKPIAVGQEITAHYGDGYCELSFFSKFHIHTHRNEPLSVGRSNRHCLCETCERLGKGGYAPQSDSEVQPSGSDDESDRGSDSETETSSVASVEPAKDVKINVNQRSTRRGVYLVLPDSASDSEDSETEVSNKLPSSFTDMSGQLTPLPSTSKSNTPEFKQEVDDSSSISQLATTKLVEGVVKQLSRMPQDASNSALISPAPSAISEKSSYKSVITTRSQKARAESTSTSLSHLATPPLSASASSASRNRSASIGRKGRHSSMVPGLPIAHAIASTAGTPASDVPVKRGRGRPRKYPLPTAATTAASATQPTTQSANTARTSSVDSSRRLTNSLDGRSLRFRKSLLSLGVGTKSGNVSEAGAVTEPQTAKILGPACMTCLTQLPQSPEETVSIGMKRKRKLFDEKLECARCVTD